MIRLIKKNHSHFPFNLYFSKDLFHYIFSVHLTLSSVISDCVHNSGGAPALFTVGFVLLDVLRRGSDLLLPRQSHRFCDGFASETIPLFRVG